MIRLAIAGATGRTGERVLRMALADDRFEVAAALAAAGCDAIGTTVRVGDGEVVIGDALDASCDVLIDFTVAAGTMAWLEVCLACGMPMVTGVTGHDDEQRERLQAAARTIPIVAASNFSIGIHLLIEAVKRLAVELGEAYDVEIVETHHRHKVDAPSGTALSLADAVANATGRGREHVVFGRQGAIGERPAGQIGVHAVRMGEAVGRHEVHFSGPGETVSVSHEAHSRGTFAAGALHAAAWAVGKAPGLYSMRDVLG